MSFSISKIRNDIASKYNVNPTTFINDKVLLNILSKSPKTQTQQMVYLKIYRRYETEFLDKLNKNKSGKCNWGPAWSLNDDKLLWERKDECHTVLAKDFGGKVEQL